MAKKLAWHGVKEACAARGEQLDSFIEHLEDCIECLIELKNDIINENTIVDRNCHAIIMFVDGLINRDSEATVTQEKLTYYTYKKYDLLLTGDQSTVAENFNHAMDNADEINPDVLVEFRMAMLPADEPKNQSDEEPPCP